MKVKLITYSYTALLVLSVVFAGFAILSVSNFGDCSSVNSFLPFLNDLRGYGACGEKTTIFYPEISAVVIVALVWFSVNRMRKDYISGKRVMLDFILFLLGTVLLFCWGFLVWLFDTGASI